MKKYKLFSFLFLIISLPLAGSSIVKYYHNLDMHIRGYSPLVYHNGRWKLKTGDHSYNNAVIVDIKNGFLEISHPVFKYRSLRLVLYIDNKKRVTLGVTKWLSKSKKYRTTRFYRKKGDEWTDITKDILPVFYLKPFLKAKYSNKVFAVIDKRIDWQQSLTGYDFYCLKLPRFGTKVQVYPNKDFFSQIKKHDFLKIKNVHNNINYTKKLYMIWNMKQGKFKLL